MSFLSLQGFKQVQSKWPVAEAPGNSLGWNKDKVAGLDD